MPFSFSNNDDDKEDSNYEPNTTDDSDFDSPKNPKKRRKKTISKTAHFRVSDDNPVQSAVHSPIPSTSNATPRKAKTPTTNRQTSLAFLTPVSESTPKKARKRVNFATPSELESSMDDLLTLTSRDWEANLTLEEKRRRRAK